MHHRDPVSNGYVPSYSCNANYEYEPSFAAAVVFTILFGLLTVEHIGLAVWPRKRFYWN
jgi:hypothetical protein